MAALSETVAFLFTDIVGSTRLWEEQPDAMGAALATHDGIVAAVVARFGGSVFSPGGDGFGIAFASVGDAIAAAVELQLALERAAADPDALSLGVRMGVHAGEVEERDGSYFGPAVNRAARIMAAANGGQIVVSASAADLVPPTIGVELADLGTFRLTGVLEPMPLVGVDTDSWRWDSTPLRARPWTSVHVPRPTNPLIGRTREGDTLGDLISHHRLVTLTGPGGVGKTRLAIEVARAAAETFPDGVWFVELAPLDDANAVMNALATALGVRRADGFTTREAVRDALLGERALIVFDNCEHVLAASGDLVQHLLDGLPDVVVLATSRQPLGVPGEVNWSVQPLEDMAAAAELFEQRAFEADARAAFTATDREDIIRLCARLEGIPLAIELAAARVSALAPAEILERLDDRFRLLRGGRSGSAAHHHALYATVDWSYQLLSVAEQRLFERLSVFAGGFDLGAAASIDDEGEADVLDLLARLVSQSMIVASRVDGHTRYSMLETLREFGAARLEARGESEAVRALHLEHFRTRAERLADLYAGPAELVAADAFALDRDNLRHALRWAEESAAIDAAADLCIATMRWAWDRMWAEHADWIARVRILLPVGSPAHARLLGAAAGWAMAVGEHEEAIRLAREALAGRCEDPAAVSDAHGYLCLALYQLGRAEELTAAAVAADEVLDRLSPPEQAVLLVVSTVTAALTRPERADEFRDRLRAAAEHVGQPVLLGWHEFARALGLLYAGEVVAAREVIVSALGTATADGSANLEGNLRGLLAIALLYDDDAASTAAIAATLTGLDVARNWQPIWWMVEAIAERWAFTDRVQTATVLLGSLEARSQDSRRAFANRSGAISAVRARPGSAGLLARGAAMNRDQVLELVLTELERPAPS